MSETSKVYPAYVWDCSHCGTENFLRPPVTDISDIPEEARTDVTEMMEEVLKAGNENAEENVFIEPPTVVTCDCCKAKFAPAYANFCELFEDELKYPEEINVDDEDDDDEDDDDSYLSSLAEDNELIDEARREKYELAEGAEETFDDLKKRAKLGEFITIYPVPIADLNKAFENFTTSQIEQLRYLSQEATKFVQWAAKYI